VRSGLVVGRPVSEPSSPLLGDLWGVLDLECRGGLRVFCRCFGIVAAGLVGDLICDLPNAEPARVDCVEFPESDAVLSRRAVLIGMRDRELRLEVVVELEEDGGSRDGDRLTPYILDVGGFEGAPEKSLLVLRCRLEGRSGIFFSILISSSVGVRPRYHAEGDEGDEGEISGIDCPRSCGNIGLGVCMLPSDPLRRRGPDIPKPRSV